MQSEDPFQGAKPYRLSHVVVLVLVGYVTALLLSGGRLHQWLEDQPPGEIRDAVLPMMTSLQGFTNRLELNRPVEEVRRVFLATMGLDEELSEIEVDLSQTSALVSSAAELPDMAAIKQQIKTEIERELMANVRQMVAVAVEDQLQVMQSASAVTLSEIPHDSLPVAEDLRVSALAEKDRPVLGPDSMERLKLELQQTLVHEIRQQIGQLFQAQFQEKVEQQALLNSDQAAESIVSVVQMASPEFDGAVSSVAFRRQSAMEEKEPVQGLSSAETQSQAVSITETDFHHRRTLFIGDSIMGTIATMAKQILTKKEKAPAPVVKWKVSTGLTRYRSFDWPKVIHRLLQQEKVEDVVVHFGTNDLMPVRYEGKTYHWQHAQWDHAYTALVDDMLDQLCQEGRHVYWLGIPSLREETLHKGTRMINGLIQKATEKRGCATFVSTNSAFGLDEADDYSSFSTIDGRKQRVRTKDGIHFNAVGGKIVANYLIELQKERDRKLSARHVVDEGGDQTL